MKPRKNHKCFSSSESLYTSLELVYIPKSISLPLIKLSIILDKSQCLSIYTAEEQMSINICIAQR
jgi:hypothetical protein